MILAHALEDVGSVVRGDGEIREGDGHELIEYPTAVLRAPTDSSADHEPDGDGDEGEFVAGEDADEPVGKEAGNGGTEPSNERAQAAGDFGSAGYGGVDILAAGRTGRLAVDLEELAADRRFTEGTLESRSAGEFGAVELQRVGFRGGGLGWVCRIWVGAH